MARFRRFLWALRFGVDMGRGFARLWRLYALFVALVACPRLVCVLGARVARYFAICGAF